MKLFSDNEKRAKDEKFVYVFILIALVVGIALVGVGMYINSSNIIVAGVLSYLIHLILLPSVIYNISRYNKNDKQSNDSTN